MLDTVALEGRAAELMEAHKIPGMALAVIYRGQVLLARGFGVTSVEDGGVPVTADTLFRIGSVSKPLAGTVIVRVVAEGRLDLDRPVTDYAAWLRFSEAGAAERVTLRMLLSHTSGLGSVANAFGPSDSEALERMAREIIPALPMEAPPGKVYAYSNPGLCLAAFVAEHVARKPFGQLAQELLFAPLGMARTTFDPLVAMTYPLALPHQLDGEGRLSVARPFADNAHYHPAGFAMTTANDLARFAMMHMGDGAPVLSPDTLAEMHRVQAPHFRPDGGGYGLAFFSETYKGRRLVRHGGGIHTYHASLDMLPDEQTAVLFMANRVFPPGVMQKLINDCFDQLLDLPDEEPATPVAEADRSHWPAHEGTYVCRFSGLARVEREGDSLVLDFEGRREPLRPHAGGAYTIRNPRGADVECGFVPEPEGRTQYILYGGRLLKRIELDPAFALPTDVLAAAPGTYVNQHTGQKEAVLREEEGRLLVAFGWARWAEAPCTPLNSATQFACPYGTFTLADGVITINGWRFAKASA